MLVAPLLALTCSLPQDLGTAFVAAARERHGELGERAARFLVEHMPDADRGLAPDYLLENLELALAARKEFPWASAVPEEMFFNDVLPWGVLDEPRDPWRAELLAIARPLVKEARSAAEAAQALNAQLFNAIGVHYHTGRKRPNQSFAESRASGKATCTGLSIVLVQACRAVGIPARAVGTPMWANLRGNHTWVEVWDGGWHFMGADEHDPAGLDRGWFVADAAQARADVPQHRIYATSWRREGVWFPLVWSPGAERVAAVDVTARYARPAAAAVGSMLGVRVRERAGGERVVAGLQLLDAQGRVVASGESRAGTADMNDVPSFAVDPQAAYTLRVWRGDDWRELAVAPEERGDASASSGQDGGSAVSASAAEANVRTLDLAWESLPRLPEGLAGIERWLARPAAGRGDAPRTPLSKAEAEMALARLWQVRLEELRAERAADMEAKVIERAGFTLRWLEKRFGDAPEGRRSLWISMHGGGGAPKEVNDRQWQNQLRLYTPVEGFYVAPRAPTDTWNLWHQEHVDALLERLIEGYVALQGVDPDRVYLLGYSAGGDGVWQLAPRMADRFAAASMMAGHPNEAQPHGLRNLPFGLFMGADDSAYGRNQVARDRAAELARLRAADPHGYEHLARIYDGLGHWMQGKDAEALPWMAGFARRAWPSRVAWLQDDVVHTRFYWLSVRPESALQGRRIDAAVSGQRVLLEGDPTGLELRLSDALLDLDQPVVIEHDGIKLFEGRLPREAAEIWRSLSERADPRTAASARLKLAPLAAPTGAPARPSK